MDDMNNSEGFYVTPTRDGSVLLGGVRPVGEYSGDHYRKAESAARFAVEEHNKKEGEKGFLKFLKIVNLNVEPTAGAIYYITMAADGGSGEMSHYQVKVWEKINTGFQVQIFRLAPYWVKSSGN
ncbi:cysteine proteinase inhibitor 1 [Phtheirospermum japonicum]|uniref:Cysteine proteinase inhibitor n=1 Tax=Phtheirospermum japonicum TaxID=374723 RepID=A0A830BEQ5_9LAMI|nr:cysteine proteinase inhibitor 1 [Phtheirospermum japonicum]